MHPRHAQPAAGATTKPHQSRGLCSSCYWQHADNYTPIQWSTDDLIAEVDHLTGTPEEIADRLGVNVAAIASAARRVGRHDLRRAYEAAYGRARRARKVVAAGLAKAALRQHQLGNACTEQPEYTDAEVALVGGEWVAVRGVRKWVADPQPPDEDPGPPVAAAKPAMGPPPRWHIDDLEWVLDHDPGACTWAALTARFGVTKNGIEYRLIRHGRRDLLARIQTANPSRNHPQPDRGDAA